MKKAEHFFMGTVKGAGKEISCQPSDFYGTRCVSPRDAFSYHVQDSVRQCLGRCRFEKFCRECILGGGSQHSTAAAPEASTTDEGVGPPRTQSSGSTAGVVLEFAGQSAFTTQRSRQRRGAVVAGAC